MIDTSTKSGPLLAGAKSGSSLKLPQSGNLGWKLLGLAERSEHYLHWAAIVAKSHSRNEASQLETKAVAQWLRMIGRER